MSWLHAAILLVSALFNFEEVLVAIALILLIAAWTQIAFGCWIPATFFVRLSPILGRDAGTSSPGDSRGRFSAVDARVNSSRSESTLDTSLGGVRHMECRGVNGASSPSISPPGTALLKTSYNKKVKTSVSCHSRPGGRNPPPLPRTVSAAESIAAHAGGGVSPSSRPEGGVATDHVHGVGGVTHSASHSPGRWARPLRWRLPVARQGATDSWRKPISSRNSQPLSASRSSGRWAAAGLTERSPCETRRDRLSSKAPEITD
ncbi:hypothetical protein EVAR_39549_1 [Eumeta japonica]|uniref:Uncharacterized protein n=1 Tax=Eumeta variegata TaxID=151549 RepID=A0A4C1XNQ2_EUMVA|nr:hypothetical protein EVAR_39549_1 [Eumeta japonica]